MVSHDEELVKRLLDKDPDFRKAYQTHRDYERKVAQFNKKTHLTAEETAEKNRLKKLKLTLKDKMEKIIAKHKG